MFGNLINYFKLFAEQEEHATVINNIDKGVVFRGTNLWILIFAIFVASLGLNVNSAAVIIGAMLISPLMGPIMGLGLGIGINDLSLLKKSLSNYLFAAFVGLATSAIYFFLSPINEAHSEILARISPNIYDVLIAFFGGLAGILAICSKQKGNVLPGVAIATALMPPLCTAGYGLATLQFGFFFGALYLFLINTVFIALATFITVRALHFPYKHLLNKQAEKKAKKIVWGIAIITILPSVYFGYTIVKQQQFNSNVNNFIKLEASFKNDYLLNKKISFNDRSVTLTFGGRKITEAEILQLREKLKFYDLSNTKLEIKQGFEYLTDNKNSEQINILAGAIETIDNDLRSLRAKFDSVLLKDSMQLNKDSVSIKN